MSKRIFDIKIKEFHEMKMGSLIMDSFINIFLVLLHYVPYIKDEKVNIQQFLGCIPPNFRERMDFGMLKTLDTTLHKARLCYEHRQMIQENMNKNWDRLRSFSKQRKIGSNPHPYKKQNNSFPPNINFNKIGAPPNVLAANANRRATNGGAKDSPDAGASIS